MNTQIIINNLESKTIPDVVIYKNGKVIPQKLNFNSNREWMYVTICLENIGPVFLSEEKKWLSSIPGICETNITEVTDVCGRGYRGHQFFESYSKKQLDVLTIELRKIVNHCGIEIDRRSFDYHCDHNDNKSIWYYNNNALSGHPGIYSVNSFCKSFGGIAPLYQLINALKSI